MEALLCHLKNKIILMALALVPATQEVGGSLEPRSVRPAWAPQWDLSYTPTIRIFLFMKSAVLAPVDYTQSGIHLVCYRVSLLRNVPTLLGSMVGKLLRGKYLPHRCSPGPRPESARLNKYVLQKFFKFISHSSPCSLQRWAFCLSPLYRRKWGLQTG